MFELRKEEEEEKAVAFTRWVKRVTRLLVIYWQRQRDGERNPARRRSVRTVDNVRPDGCT